MSTVHEIDSRVARLLGRLRLAFRAVLTALRTDGPVVLLQADALAGERLQDNELMQHYGYTSAPPAGTMAIVLPLGGQSAHGVIVATEHAAYRVRNLAAGEVALYTDEGDSIVFKRGRSIEITAGTKVRIVAPTLEIAGNVVITGTVTDNGKNIGSTHTHGGIEPGGGNTGGPN